MIRRLPLRFRLALAFAAVMAVVLGTVGGVVYVELRANLDEGITEGLRTRADAVARLAASAGGPRSAPATESDADSAAQVLGRDGRVLLASPPDATRPLLDAAAVRRARAGEVVTEGPGPSGDTFRVLATPAAGGRVAVVAESLADRRDEPLRLVALLLLLGLPLALVLATLAAARVAGGALRPVEALRREAEGIGAEHADRRLPVAAGDDELARLGRTLNAMLDRIEAGVRRQRAFVADAAHELRTPLAILQAETELSLRHAATVEEHRAALRANQDEIARLSRLSEDLLLLARADSEAPGAPVPVALAPLAEEILARFAAVAEREGRRLVLETGPAGLQALASAPAIERALTALLDNALRHGGGMVAVAIERVGGLAVLGVRDHGEGVPDGLLPVVFERFTRGDGARGRGGTGLGLALVAATAERFGGRVTARNHPGGGAELRLELPAAQPLLTGSAGLSSPP